jgi:diguanylate cyclase (GGDEF)-like protein
MAAIDQDPSSQPLQGGGVEPLAATALDQRMDEEISRAERHGTKLSCLLLVIENLDEMAYEHGSQLPEETLAYVAGALRREIRRFDRIGRPSEDELMILLPGADGPLGEIVARRVLERVRAIKVEVAGRRSPLQVSVGLAAWRADMTGSDLLARTRAATRRRNGEDAPPPPDQRVGTTAAGTGVPRQRTQGLSAPAAGRASSS